MTETGRGEYEHLRENREALNKGLRAILDNAEAEIGEAEANGQKVVAIQINEKTLEYIKTGLEMSNFAGMTDGLDLTDPIPEGGVGRIHDVDLVINNEVKPGLVAVKTKPIQKADDTIFETSRILKNLEAMGIKIPKEHPGDLWDYVM